MHTNVSYGPSKVSPGIAIERIVSHACLAVQGHVSRSAPPMRAAGTAFSAMRGKGSKRCLRAHYESLIHVRSSLHAIIAALHSA